MAHGGEVHSHCMLHDFPTPPQEGDASKSRPSVPSMVVATTSLSPTDMRIRLLKSLPPKNICDQYINRYFSTIGVT